MDANAVLFTGHYLDGAGKIHAVLSFAPEAGKTLRGDVVYDPSLERTILDETLADLPREALVALKRAAAANLAAWHRTTAPSEQ